MGEARRRKQAMSQNSSLKGHKISVMGVTLVLVLLVAVVSVSGLSLKAKQRDYIAQEKELKAQIQEQEELAKEIEELEQYVGTDEYVEQTARDKLGLVHEGEIIFKSK